MLATKITELKQDRAKLVSDMRKILNEAGTRSLRADEEESVDKYEKAIGELDKRITALEKAAEGESDEDDEEDRDEDEKDKDDEERGVVVVNGKRMIPIGTGKTPTRPQKRNNDGGSNRLVRFIGETDEEYTKRERRSAKKYVEGFQRYVLGGERALNNFMAREQRALSADVDFNGGYLTMPQMFVQQLIKQVDNLLWIRQLATKFQLPSAQSLGAPVLDTDVDDADWTSELATGNLDNALAFGKRELQPRPLAKRLKASNKLLRMAAVSSTFSAYDAESGTGPIENFIISRLKYKLAVPQEKAFMTGNGVNQALGVFTASTRGISTSRDVSTGSTTGITGDGLIAAKYSLKMQYHNTAKWLFHRDAVRRIRQLKDNYGQYLWMPGLQAGSPDQLLSLPIMISEYVPNTFTDTNYVGMLGDFSFYWIADSVEYQIQKLVELYAEANQTGFIVRAEVDGMPVLEEAFARLVCGA